MNKQAFAYEGKASITIEYNGKKIKYSNHNEGTPQLFRLYAKALAGYNTFEDRPVSLDIRYSTAIDGNYDTVLNKKPPLTAGNWYFDNFYESGEGGTVETENDWITYYTGIIESSDIAGGKLTGVTSDEDSGLYWRLYILDKNDYDMAYINLGSLSENNLGLIQPGVKAVIEWTTCVRNVKTESDLGGITNVDKE